MNTFLSLITESIDSQTFIRCIWSNPRKSIECTKIMLRPILIKEQMMIQVTKSIGQKEFHENLALEDVLYWCETECNLYKQAQLFTTTADYQALFNKKGVGKIKNLAPSKTTQTPLTHNRQKKYILDTPSSEAFLKALGLMDDEGKIKPSKYDKYKQINRYLEIVADSMNALSSDTLRIIDFGCGKSYLTFALYHYLTVILNKTVEVIGLDLKEDVIAFCNDLSTKLGYNHLHFQVGDIGKYTTDQSIDMVISLHACNTATDAALEKAIKWGSKIILAVPCCHHEAYTQIQNDTLAPIFKHGILKERIAALVTDGLRAQLLEASGYKVQMIEFIDMSHTPKNILIKAIQKTTSHFEEDKYMQYQEVSNFLNLDLTLNTLLNYSTKVNTHSIEDTDYHVK